MLNRFIQGFLKFPKSGTESQDGGCFEFRRDTVGYPGRLPRTTVAIMVLILSFCACFGCDGKQRLRGKVTFSDDGSPVPVGSVFFETPTFVAQGDIRPDGTYVVGSTGLADGIPLGEYKVYIAGAERLEYREVKGEKVDVHVHLIDGKYLSPRTSGLTFNADGKTRRFDIEVDRAAPKP